MPGCDLRQLLGQRFRDGPGGHEVDAKARRSAGRCAVPGPIAPSFAPASARQSQARLQEVVAERRHAVRGGEEHPVPRLPSSTAQPLRGDRQRRRSSTTEGDHRLRPVGAQQLGERARPDGAGASRALAGRAAALPVEPAKAFAQLHHLTHNENGGMADALALHLFHDAAQVGVDHALSAGRSPLRSPRPASSARRPAGDQFGARSPAGVFIPISTTSVSAAVAERGPVDACPPPCPPPRGRWRWRRRRRPGGR